MYEPAHDLASILIWFGVGAVFVAIVAISFEMFSTRRKDE